MKVINLRLHQIRNLKELSLEKGILNTEALMLILNKKQSKSKNGGTMVFKYMDAQDDDMTMARKNYTISMLSSSKEYSKIEELIIPDTIITVDGKFVGIAMPLVKNHKNLGALINDDDILLEDKLPYLRQVGNIIDKVQRVKDEPFKMQFCDFNEYNFIIDENNKVKAVDLDSAYVGQDEPSNSAYYLLKNNYLDQVKDKYNVVTKSVINPFDKNGAKISVKSIIPNDNSDLYCYNMIILDTLANEKMFKQDIDIYYKYINHLKDIGIDKELVDAFKTIYVHKDNVNPKDMICGINSNIVKDADFKVFKKEYNI